MFTRVLKQSNRVHSAACVKRTAAPQAACHRLSNNKSLPTSSLDTINTKSRFIIDIHRCGWAIQQELRKSNQLATSCLHNRVVRRQLHAMNLNSSYRRYAMLIRQSRSVPPVLQVAPPVIQRRHHGGRALNRHHDFAEELKEGQQITIVGLVANILLTIGKGVAGVVGQSTALIADAVHSLGDLVSDGVTLVTHRIAREPGDTRLYPYGRGKYEALGSLFVSALLISSGLAIGWHSVVELFTALTGGSEHSPTRIALYAALVSLITKEILYQLTLRVARKQNSMVLEANAWHHRTDAISSILAFIGVGGEMLGVPGLDALAGIAVAGIIGWAGYPIMIDSIAELVDKHNEPELCRDITKCMEETMRQFFSKNSHIARIRLRKYGPRVCVDAQVHVDLAHMPETTALDVAILKMKERIHKDFPVVQEILIEFEPELHSSTTTRSSNNNDKTNCNHTHNHTHSHT